MKETEKRNTGRKSRTGRTKGTARACNICGVAIVEPAKVCNACMTFYKKKLQEDL